MKKTLLAIALFAIAGTAYANTGDFVYNTSHSPSFRCPIGYSHPVFNQDSTFILSCEQDGAWDKAMEASLAAQNPKLPVFLPGSTVVDQWGIDYTCYEWDIKCVSLVHTPEYISSMQRMAKDLLAQGRYDSFSFRFGKLMDSVR